MGNPIPFKKTPVTPTSTTSTGDPAATEITQEMAEQIQGLRQLVREGVESAADAAGFSSVPDRLTALESNLSATQSGTPPEVAEPEVTDDDYYREPVVTTRRIANDAARKVAEEGRSSQMAGLLAARRMNEMDLADDAKLGRDFLLLRDEFAEAAKGIPPEMLADDNFNGTGQSGVYQLFHRVRGMHMDELLERRDNQEAKAETDSRLSAPYTERATSRSGRKASPGDKLSDEEKKVAERMEMSQEDYLLWRGKRNERPDDLPPGI